MSDESVPLRRTGQSDEPRDLKLADLVAKSLLNSITSRGLEAGTVLPNERQMMQDFDVGRVTIREALRILESLGLIRIKPGPGGGPVVAEPRAEAYASSTTMLYHFMGVTYAHGLNARLAFEPMVAVAAAENRSEEHLGRMADSADTMSAPSIDLDAFHDAYRAFHITLGEASRNRLLIMSNGVFRSVWELAERDAHAERAYRKRAASAHRDIVTALRDRDSREARAASTRHLQNYQTWLQRNRPELLTRTIEWAPVG